MVNFFSFRPFWLLICELYATIISMDWKVLGHNWAVEALSKHINRNAVRHAYLFTGPQSVGRRTLALGFAQALNCRETTIPGQPCGRCRNCKLIEQMEHPDLMVVEAEQVGVKLKIDQIREIQHTLSLSAYEAKYRIAIFLRFDEASHQAMNALLKTLEEPPAHVILLMTAANEELLLPTISSRCEILRLRPMPVDQLSQDLHSLWGFDPEKARLAAHISGGRPGYAYSLLTDTEVEKERNSALEILVNLLAGTRVERFAYVEKHYKDKNTVNKLLQNWLSFWRDVLLVAAGSKTPVQNIDQLQIIRDLAGRFGMDCARNMVNSLDRTMSLLNKNVSSRLALEILMLDLPFTNS